MTPQDRKTIAKKIEEYYQRRNRPRFYSSEGNQVTVGEFVGQIRTVPLALKFDVSLTDADKIRLHAWGVSA
jgi:hypothetical protein